MESGTKLGHYEIIGIVAALSAAVLLGGCVPSASDPGTDGPTDASSAPGASGTALFEGARLIVGDGSVIEQAAFLVDEGRFVQVGRSGGIDLPDDATRVDLAGSTVIPALIDAHTHLGYEGFTSWGAENYSRENVIEHLERYAYYGFGAVFSAGTDPDDLALEIQQSQRNGDVGGARFLFAGGMGPPGQGPNNQFIGHTLAVERETGLTVLRGAGSPEEGRNAVREIAAKGISFVKIWVDDRGGNQDKLSPDIYHAIVEEATTNGMKVFVHQQSAEDMPDLLDAGVAGFLHGRIGPALDDAVAAQLAVFGAFLVPNLGLGELRREPVGADPFLREATPTEAADRLLQEYEARQAEAGNAQEAAAAQREQELVEGFSRLQAAGVDLILGTDSGPVPGHFFGYTGHRELEIFVRLGMTPAEAIVAGTSSPAQHLGLTELGTIAPGKSADFVVLEANPLEDIRNTRTISDVYLRGGRVDRAALRSRWTD